MQINRKIDYHKKFSKQQQINVTIVSGKSTKIFEFFSNLKCVLYYKIKGRSSFYCMPVYGCKE
jgi:hypothetical protein